MKKFRQRLDFPDLLAAAGLILLGLAIYKVAEITGVTFYVGALLITISLVISYQQGKNAGG